MTATSKKQQENMYDLIIIGAGTAGLAAGLYAGRYLMKTVIIGAVVGGEGVTGGMTYNYPGFLEIDGFDLMQKMREQVEHVGVEILHEQAVAVEKRGHCFAVRTANSEAVGNTLILATGSERRKLGLPREAELKGKGIHYCITCDGPLYRGKTIALVGGGDASVKGLNLIADYVQKIYLIVRGTELKAEPINLEHMKKLGDKVSVLYETEVRELQGKDRIESVRLSKPYTGSDVLAVDGLFIEIGAVPNTDFAKQLGVALDAQGYITTDNLMRTNIDGVFAAGDTVNHFGSFKQYVTAAALGTVAATSAYNDHKIHGELCEIHALPMKVHHHPAAS